MFHMLHICKLSHCHIVKCFKCPNMSHLQMFHVCNGANVFQLFELFNLLHFHMCIERADRGQRGPPPTHPHTHTYVNTKKSIDPEGSNFPVITKIWNSSIFNKKDNRCWLFQLFQIFQIWFSFFLFLFFNVFIFKIFLYFVFVFFVFYIL